MSGIVGSKLNIRGSGLVGSLGTDGQHLLSSGAGKTNVFETAAAAGTTAPYVCVSLGSDQALSDDSVAKVEFDTELVDSDGTFASNAFTPTVVGKYYVDCNLTFETDVRLRFTEVTCYIYKNGSAAIQTHAAIENNSFEAEGYTQSVSGIVECDADDYIEIYAKVNVAANTPNVAGGSNLSCLTIFKMTE